MFCNRCGTRNDDGSRFCTRCGAPAASPRNGDAEQTHPPVPMPTDAPPAIPAPPAPGVAGAAVTSPAPTPPTHRRRLPWVVAIVAAVTAVSLCAAFLTYRAEWWGGRTLPDAAEVTGIPGMQPTADQVVKALRAEGFHTEVVRRFSALSDGLFLGYADFAEGQRVATETVIKVVESAGPGIPQGTVGSRVEDVADDLEAMNVPVHYKRVVVSDDSRYPEGQIVATSPADGQALERDRMGEGMFIGVAGKGDGVPFDILGKDTQEAVQELTAAGYQVMVEPRFSSRDYVGKVAGSSPGPGSALESGQPVTLYHGVDVSADQDMLTTIGYDGYRLADGDLSVLAGSYCKASGEGTGDCVTLEAAPAPFYADEYTAIRIAGHDESMVLYNFSQDISGMLVDPGESGLFDPDTMPMRNHLLLSGWGMFEVYAGMGLPRCGTHQMQNGPGEYCDDGVYRTYEPGGDWSPPLSTGETYDMQDFLVYFPVGSDIDALEASGYFDDGALQAASGLKQVDADRPFILIRDPGQYDRTSIPLNIGTRTTNPFVPGNDDGDNPLVPMRPAVSDDTVYYLVEQAEPDWATLPDADVPASDGSDDEDDKDGSDSDDGAAADAASLRIFRSIAGDYGFSSGAGGWGTTMTVNADGTFDGYYSDSELGDTGAGYPNGSLYESRFSGRFASAVENDDGTYTLQCAADELSVEGETGSERIEDGTRIITADPYGVSPCGTFTVYPPGFDTSRLSDEVTSWSSAWMVDGLPATLGSPIIVNDNERESFYAAS